MTLTRHVYIALAICFMVLLIGCGSSAPWLTSLQVSPAAESLSAVGATAQFTAVGSYTNKKQRDSSSDVTTQATWSSSVPTVATVNSTGLVTAVSSGTTTITASIGGVLGTAALTVTITGGGGGGTANDLTSLTIIPAAGAQVVQTPGETAQFIAIGTFSGSPATKDMTNKVTWVSSDVRLATINSSGLATDVGSGGNSTSTTITAIALNNEGATITGVSDLTVRNEGVNTLPTLTVYKVGQGSGTVVSSPSGINCGSGADCSAHFTLNASVTLTATPDQVSKFAGWSANCIPTDQPTCSLNMTDNATVGVIFNPK
jgi:hypothetical protein